MMIYVALFEGVSDKIWNHILIAQTVVPSARTAAASQAGRICATGRATHAVAAVTAFHRGLTATGTSVLATLT